MKVLQISTVCGSGSVGRITVDIYHTLEKQGDDCLIAYGRRTAPKGVHAFCFGSPVSMGIHVLSTFFKGEHGFASASATRKLIRKIEEWNPDDNFPFSKRVSFGILVNKRDCAGTKMHRVE